MQSANPGRGGGWTNLSSGLVPSHPPPWWLHTTQGGRKWEAGLTKAGANPPNRIVDGPAAPTAFGVPKSD